MDFKNPTGSDIKQIISALQSAFPTYEKLKQMLHLELDKQLERITAKGSLNNVLYELIEQAKSENWVEELLEGANEANPTNTELSELLGKKFSSIDFNKSFPKEKEAFSESNLKPILGKKKINPYTYLDLFNEICSRNFPKNERGIVHSKDDKRIGRLLNDFQQNLACFNSLLWWHNGYGNFSISDIITVGNKTWRLGSKEHKIEEIWIKYDDSIINDFIIVHYLPQKAFEIDGKKKFSTILLDGKHHITHSEMGNGYAEIEGEIIDIFNKKKEVIERSDKEGYFIIATNYHCILTIKNNENVVNLLTQMLSKPLSIEELRDFGKEIRKNKNKHVEIYL